MIWDVDGITIRGHSGGFPGFTTKIGFSPEWSLAAAVLSNRTARAGDGARCDVPQRRRVVRRWSDAAETASGHTRTSLGRFAGHYRGDIGEMTIVRINRSLYLLDPEIAMPLARQRAYCRMARGDSPSSKVTTTVISAKR